MKEGEMLPGSTETYLYRYVDHELNELFGELRAIAIDGAKGVGKTLTASKRVDKLIYLDEAAERQLLEADTYARLQSAPSVCIDEWQNYPPVWDAVRRLVDRGADTRFLLTGSATPIADVTTHTGAGRIASLRMRSLALSERRNTKPTVMIADLFEGRDNITGETEFRLADYADAICQTGFPGFQTLSSRSLRVAIDGYIQRIIDRDIVDMGVKVRKPEALRAWLKAYAAATATTTNYSKILNAATPADSDKPTRGTVDNYRELLTKLWILEPLSAWSPNVAPLARLVQSPKHHLMDPGLAAFILGITPATLLSGAAGTGEIFGQLFESLALLTIRSAAQASEARAYHVRTKGGEHEIDAVIERYDGRVIAFEMKIAAAVTDSDAAHLLWLKERLGDQLVDMVIVTTGTHAFRRPDGVAVVPLALLG